MMMKLLLITITLLVLSPLAAFSQVEGCPQGFICLTQEQANIAAQNARELPIANEKIAVLEAAVKAERENTKNAQDTAAKNEAELKAALHKTELQLAEKTGQLIKSEANEVRNTAIIEMLLKMARKKCLPLSVCIN